MCVDCIRVAAQAYWAHTAYPVCLAEGPDAPPGWLQRLADDFRGRQWWWEAIYASEAPRIALALEHLMLGFDGRPRQPLQALATAVVATVLKLGLLAQLDGPSGPPAWLASVKLGHHVRAAPGAIPPELFLPGGPAVYVLEGVHREPAAPIVHHPPREPAAAG